MLALLVFQACKGGNMILLINYICQVAKLALRVRQTVTNSQTHTLTNSQTHKLTNSQTHKLTSQRRCNDKILRRNLSWYPAMPHRVSRGRVRSY